MYGFWLAAFGYAPAFALSLVAFLWAFYAIRLRRDKRPLVLQVLLFAGCLLVFVAVLLPALGVFPELQLSRLNFMATFLSLWLAAIIFGSWTAYKGQPWQLLVVMLLSLLFEIDDVKLTLSLYFAGRARVAPWVGRTSMRLLAGAFLLTIVAGFLFAENRRSNPKEKDRASIGKGEASTSAKAASVVLRCLAVLTVLETFAGLILGSGSSFESVRHILGPLPHLGESYAAMVVLMFSFVILLFISAYLLWLRKPSGISLLAFTISIEMYYAYLVAISPIYTYRTPGSTWKVVATTLRQVSGMVTSPLSVQVYTLYWFVAGILLVVGYVLLHLRSRGHAATPVATLDPTAPSPASN